MRNWIIAVISAAAVAWPAAAPAQQPIVIKFSHVVAPDTPKGKGAEKFKELAEKYTRRQGQGRGLSELDSSTRTRRSSRRCSSAPCRCWRPRTRSSGRSA